MKQNTYVIQENRPLTRTVYEMRLHGDTSALEKPGQFVNIQLAGKYLRRPISVCDYDAEGMTLLYKVVGEGTAQMSHMRHGEKLDLLTGLGNGFSLEKAGESPLLVGGGIGIPPLYGLAKALLANGKKPQVILGFNSGDEVFYVEEFEQLGLTVHVATVDGSLGTKGYVTQVMAQLTYSYFYTCGPMAMFRAIEEIAKTSGQFSFEERMGCGFGACMGCTCKTKYGNKRICKDGPVLEREEIIW